MRTLVAIDGNAFGVEVMKAVAHLAGPADDVHVLSVVAPVETRPNSSSGALEQGAAPRRPGPDERVAGQRALDDRREHLRALAHHIPGGPRWQLHVVTGQRPAEVILETARQLAVHNIAMGTRGRNALQHLLLGSVAETVIRSASVPVLVVRDGIEIAWPAVRSPMSDRPARRPER